MKIAIVLDWLSTLGGAENVLKQLLICYPEADIFTTVDFLPENQRDFLKNKKITTTFIQKLPFAKNKFRNYLLLMPLAIEQLDVLSYDLVISNSHAVAKGVITGPDQCHIAYVQSPMRYAWDLQYQYLKQTGLDRGIKGWIAKLILHQMRLWDVRTVHGVDHFIANSNYIARRIRKTYGRESTVLYPPVDVAAFDFCAHKEDFYVTASRLVPYKRIDLIVEAFSHLPDKKLIVVGEGPEMEKIKSKAAGGENIEILGYQSFSVLKNYLQKAKAFIFAAEEDFGILPLEAQACGTPVIAYGKGGCLETVRGLDHSHPTGVFFPDQACQSIIEAISLFEKNQSHIKIENCRENAIRFSNDRFRNEFTQFVDSKINKMRPNIELY